MYKVGYFCPSVWLAGLEAVSQKNDAVFQNHEKLYYSLNHYTHKPP